MQNYYKSVQYLVRVLLLCLFTLMFNQTAYAQVRSGEDHSGPFFGKEAKGKWIIGVKAGKIDNNVETVSDADAIGLVLGYEFARPIGIQGGSSTVELEFLSGDETNIDSFGEYEVDILNLFFTYRSAGKLYYKIKGGLSYSNVDVSFPAVDFSNEEVALAAGIGLGYHIGDYGVIELEYSQDSGDNDLGVLAVSALLEF